MMMLAIVIGAWIPFRGFLVPSGRGYCVYIIKFSILGINGIVGGPVLGGFTLGMFIPWANSMVPTYIKIIFISVIY